MKDRLNRFLYAFLAPLALLSGCGHGKQTRPEIGTFPDTWEYPIRPGIPRAQVHELLGSESRSTRELEEYPPSGVTVWFDNNDKVTKVGFGGDAGAIYGNSSLQVPLASDRPLLFGLTGHSGEADFRRALGTPKQEIEEGGRATRELHCIWRKDGYVVDALFLNAERHSAGKNYPPGSLVWFEAYRGL
jgi:hypothetical protein